ncbi:putative F-box only protein 28-like [Apostichopus japonicus]|uniref:Putative F-box only protein 28-like n=1 Tax=Stichopus japonicus TaxID=307972 RepID=A0A2G8JSU4_STIJA|nr:putative F-box only protein 28-like [Apostichopus japonicus]
MEYKDDYFPSLEFKLSLRRAASRLADLNVPGVESRTDNAMSRSSNLVPVMNVGQASSKQNSKNGGETTKSVFRQINRTLLMMPDDILTMVMALLSYDEISQLRVVCHRFNRICQRLLNQGLQKLERYHGDCLKKLKAQLPRRESERRQHPLARHCDILSAVETRLSLLAMTYSKYIDLKVCCFIPGKVIDEAMHVLTLVMESKEAPRTHDLLQELRDISSMAMEHFDEKIAPGLKRKLGEGQTVNVNTIGAALSLKDLPKAATLMPSTSGRQLGKMQSTLKAANYNFSDLVKEMKVLKAQVAELRKVRHEQDKKITQQQQIVVELTSKITSQNERITEQERKMALLEQQLKTAPRPSGQPQMFYAIDEGHLEEGQEDKSLDLDETREEKSSDPTGVCDDVKDGVGFDQKFSESGYIRGERDSETDEDNDSKVSMSTRGSQRSSRKRKVSSDGEKPSGDVKPLAAGVKKRRQRNDKSK